MNNIASECIVEPETDVEEPIRLEIFIDNSTEVEYDAAPSLMMMIVQLALICHVILLNRLVDCAQTHDETAEPCSEVLGTILEGCFLSRIRVLFLLNQRPHRMC